MAIDASRTNICKGDSVSFAATVTNGSAQPAFQWLINGRGIAGDDSTAYHSDSLANGDVITCLIASDDVCGLAKSNSIPIEVDVTPVIAPDQSSLMARVLPSIPLLAERCCRMALDTRNGSF